jgi:hypothetical protein
MPKGRAAAAFASTSSLRLDRKALYQQREDARIRLD